ncbi:condensation domain-containing protein, partial [Streptomyces sp. NPDC006529]|uniref:condensation domain-containing protein n=1 Tax=Streptomyces sp. NPDC006529 TaxID=3157177 RepID=UPI0033A2FB89
FTAALQQVIDRHDIFRTSIVWEGLREPVQVVRRHAVLPVTELALDPHGGEPAEQLLERVGLSMDLKQAPLIRVQTAAAPGSDQWLALIRVHHMVQDHTALEIVFGEVEAFLSGRGDTLPDPLPFRDFVAQARGGAARAEHERYFAGLLGDVTEPTAPFDVVDVRSTGANSVHEGVPLGAELTARLRQASIGLGASTATVLHVAWARVLAVLSGRDDIVFGTVLFGRMNAGAGSDRVPGPFINTLPVRVRTHDMGVTTAVSAMRGQLADLLEHEHASLALAQQASGVPADTPLFTSFFNYRHNASRQDDDEQRSHGREGIRLLLAQERSNFPLGVSVDDDGHSIDLSVEAVTPIDPQAVGRLLRTAVGNLLCSLEEGLDAPLSAVDVLDAAERELVVSGWNDTVVEVAAVTVPELFAAHVAASPDAVAVVFDGVEVSYGELDARANRLAHALIAQGVGAESVVGLCLPRGVDMVASILAVWKAGGAYVPLDPELPVERLAFMVADSG